MMRMGRKHIRWQDLLVIPLFMLAATGIGVLFEAIGFPETNIVLVYVAAVLLVARFTHGLYYGLAASVIATFAFNYFFTEPRFTFAVSDTSYLITFAIMMFTSLITSALTARVKRSAREATERPRGNGARAGDAGALPADQPPVRRAESGGHRRGGRGERQPNLLLPGGVPRLRPGRAGKDLLTVCAGRRGAS